jgi:hypothetical protein
MKTRRITLPLALFFAAALSGATWAKDDARIPALRAAEAARFQANVDADAKVLGQVLDDALEYVHSNGEVDSKASFIESLTSGRRDYVATTFDIQGLRILGDVAIIRGTAKITVADDGKALALELGYTDVWVWKNQRWQMTAWRSARMPPPSAK